MLSYFGVTMFYFRVPFLDVFILSDDWIPLITVLWLLGMTQAINLIDGLDGLAAGIVAIGALRVLPLQPAARPTRGRLLDAAQHRAADRDHHRRDLRRLPAAQLQPGAIFMGDGGALLLGLLLAVSTSVVGGRADPNPQRLRRPDLLLPRPAVHPAVHPRRADPRHAVRDHPPRRRAARAWPRPTRATCTTG